MSGSLVIVIATFLGLVASMLIDRAQPSVRLSWVRLLVLSGGSSWLCYELAVGTPRPVFAALLLAAFLVFAAKAAWDLISLYSQQKEN
ncbi:MAG: hypothetical protein U5L08_07265 [Xanthomonadales bacterium]|nr:hypothetical protein [Xanthomonadales bacterium]